MKHYYVLIDESGTLPDKKDSVVILASVIESNLSKLEIIIKSVLKNTNKKSHKTELKFYTASDKQKQLFFSLIKKSNIWWHALICVKKNKSIEDSPRNYALLATELLKNILTHKKDVIYHIIFDRHFSRIQDLNFFNSLIIDSFPFLDKKNIEHVDSMNNKIINVADMIAGSLLAKEHDKSPFYYLSIKHLGVVRRVEWVRLRKEKSSEPV